MARALSTVFSFNTSGVSSLLYARNVVRSLGGTSWGAFNQMSRGMSTVNREFTKMAAGIGSGIGFAALGRSMIMANAELQTNKLIFQEMVQDAEEANKMIYMLQENAAKYGYDLGEVFKSARGLYAGFAGGGRKVDTQDLEDILKMVETAQALDTENRGLSFYAFSFKEISQALGKGDFRSVQNRLELTFGTAVQQAVTKALQSGNVKEAIKHLKQGMINAKADSKLLDVVAHEGFVHNLNRLKSYVGRVFLTLGDPLFKSLARSLSRFNDMISESFKPGSPLEQMLLSVGKNIEKNFKAFVRPALIGLFEWMDSDAGSTFGKNIQIFFENIGVVAKESLGVVIAFAKGLNLMDENANADFRTLMIATFDRIRGFLPILQQAAGIAGIIARYIIDIALKNPEITSFIAAFHLLGGTGILVGVLGLVRAFGLLGGMLGGGAGGVAVGGGLIILAQRLVRVLWLLRQPMSVIWGIIRMITAARWAPLLRYLPLIMGHLRPIATILMHSPIGKFGLYGAFLGLGVLLGNYLRKEFPQIDAFIGGLIDKAMKLAGLMPNVPESENGEPIKAKLEDYNFRKKELIAIARRDNNLALSDEDKKILHNLDLYAGKFPGGYKLYELARKAYKEQMGTLGPDIFKNAINIPRTDIPSTKPIRDDYTVGGLGNRGIRDSIVSGFEQLQGGQNQRGSQPIIRPIRTEFNGGINVNVHINNAGKDVDGKLVGIQTGQLILKELRLAGAEGI